MRPIIPPPIIGLATAGILWLCAHYLPAQTVTFPGQGILAAVMAGIGLAIEGTGLLAFLRQRTTINPLHPERARQLVVSRLYRLSRNPMYLGMACLLTGWSLYLGSLAAMVIVPGFIWVLTEVQIKPEEAALEALFGDDYRAYKAQVRRWL